MRRNLLLSLTCALPLIRGAPSPAPRKSIQPATVGVSVVDELSRRALTNADVIDLNTGIHRFTNEDGELRLPWPPDGRLHLRVRQVGYQPLTKVINRADVPDRGVFFPLKRVAYIIPGVKATGHCSTEGDSTSRILSASVLEQLRQGAEKYEQFRRTYPFDADVKSRLVHLTLGKNRRRLYDSTAKYRSDNWEGRYRPGNIVERPGSNMFHLPLLFLSTLADSSFWDHHCFVARGVESYQGQRVLRLEFSPRTDVNGPDWAGTALLDSATSLLRRVDFNVTNLRERDLVARVEGYSTYSSPSPYLVVPDSTLAIWWFHKPEHGEDWGTPDFAQSLHVEALKYKKGTPPQN